MNQGLWKNLRELDGNAGMSTYSAAKKKRAPWDGTREFEAIDLNAFIEEAY